MQKKKTTSRTPVRARAARVAPGTGSRSAATRERILDAAEKLFAERGYHGVSIRDVTGAAEVDVALVNYHFGSKEMLLEAVVARRADQLVDEWKRALAGVQNGHATRVWNARCSQ